MTTTKLLLNNSRYCNDPQCLSTFTYNKHLDRDYIQPTYFSCFPLFQDPSVNQTIQLTE